MNSIQGKCLSYPFAPDQRGTLASIGDAAEIARQSIIAIIETRQGERVMLPDYGIPDFVFSVIDAGFAQRLAYHVEQQIKKYEPLVEEVNAKVGTEEDGIFLDSSNPHRAAVKV